mgnify:CR=1 FL=1
MRTTDEALFINFGILYPFLERMERKGLVRSAWVKRGPERKIHVYEITAAGRKALEKTESTWLRVIKQLKNMIRVPA